MWQTLGDLVHEVTETVRRVERQADSTKSRADEATRTSKWAERRSRDVQVQQELATRSHQTIENFEWQMQDLNFGGFRELSPTFIATIIRQEFERVSGIDANGKPITFFTDRGTLLNTVRRVVQILSPVNQILPEQSDRGLAGMPWPAQTPTAAQEGVGSSSPGQDPHVRAPPDRCRGLQHVIGVSSNAAGAPITGILRHLPRRDNGEAAGWPVSPIHGMSREQLNEFLFPADPMDQRDVITILASHMSSWPVPQSRTPLVTTICF